MTKLFSGFLKQRDDDRRAQFRKSLIHYEAKIGGQLFGTVPKDHRREFFCLDQRTWVWHEEWKDESGGFHALTTRYDVRPSGVVKAQGNAAYQSLNPQELRNFRQAVKMYVQRIDQEYRRMLGTA